MRQHAALEEPLELAHHVARQPARLHIGQPGAVREALGGLRKDGCRLARRIKTPVLIALLGA